jgi:hypothetical protein
MPGEPGRFDGHGMERVADDVPEHGSLLGTLGVETGPLTLTWFGNVFRVDNPLGDKEGSAGGVQAARSGRDNGMGGRVASRHGVAGAVDDFRAIAGVFQLRLARRFVRIALRCLYSLLDAVVRE